MTERSTIIATYLREQAEWRRLKATEYPEDDRNGICAAELEALASHVAALTDEDPRIAALAVAISPDPFATFCPGEEARRLISRYGFWTPGPRQPPPDPDRFLAELAELVPREREAREPGGAYHREPS